MIKTMKHNFLKIALVAAVVATAGYGVYENQRQDMMSEVMMENVEALASDEMHIEDLINNCVWQEFSYCYYIVVTPNGNTVWQHWNMRNI